MGDVQKGFFWHVHHDKLIEFCYGYEERASFIRTDKPTHEQKTRLRLFKPVKGSLPQEVIEAGQAYAKAGQAYDKAWQAYNKAWQAYDKAEQAYGEALKNNMPAITALHEKECPNCPWNGETIFSEI